ncbi:Ktr system potassium uptake protein B [Jannaschia seosinensis]|uniref:Ktr system potassium uptake protein B n=1 Tax=Jannaschia seosinensis TaxID=313367 RepID=A0A0M7B954_9RHOB|nr:TrkH family potassium uptake protein [Jannaschia seosinensis]CUH39317.1 Ktr system potassium uptake protein B [Jannaschia seosinensis]
MKPLHLGSAGILRHVPPPAALSMLYAGLVILGTAALMLPFATTRPIAWSDAVFTATSAVTVTGLAVVDTGTGFTLFGQIVIAILIQLGGLGLMTSAVLVLSMLGRSVGFSHQVYLREDLNQTSLTDLVRLVAIIVRVVAVVELAGAALLAIVFVPEFGWWPGLWHAVFHSVSAFNNAGFALFPDSLSAWVANPLINLVIPALFIIGGLGFTVLSDLNRTRDWRHLRLHSKIMLAGTAALIAWSVPTFAVLEWTNPATIGDLDIGGKLLASWFQAVTTRTAGFNTVDIAGLHDSTSLMFMSLMTIGGGSTSTAGGIKVSTFVVLLLATAAFFRRRQNLNVFGRRLGLEEVMKVLALAMVSVLVMMTAMFLILLSHDGQFVDLSFEVVSAFGTVGLSRGATGELDALGRIIIMLLMFIGRVGPLTLGFFLATRIPARVRYPAGRVHLG